MNIIIRDKDIIYFVKYTMILFLTNFEIESVPLRFNLRNPILLVFNVIFSLVEKCIIIIILLYYCHKL